MRAGGIRGLGALDDVWRSIRLARTLTAARRRAGVWMVVSGRQPASTALSAAAGQGACAGVSGGELSQRRVDGA